MLLTFAQGTPPPARRPQIVGPGRFRKVGIVGGAPSVKACPWQDPSWEFWGHTSVALMIPYLRCDRLFDMHPEHVFQEKRKNGFADYYQWLQQCPTPLYMQKAYKAIPQSVRYPRDLIEQTFPGVPVGSHVGWMVALALLEGVTHLGFFGIDLSHGSEYGWQRANAEHWAGIARGMGVHLVIPSVSPFCHEPKELYAYESHTTPEDYARKKAEFLAAKTKARELNGHTQAMSPLDSPTAYAEAAKRRATRLPEWVKETASWDGHEPEPAEVTAMYAALEGATPQSHATTRTKKESQAHAQASGERRQVQPRPHSSTRRRVRPVRPTRRRSARR